MAHISLTHFHNLFHPHFCYIIHKIAIRFRHWSSRATPGTPASICVYIYIYRKDITEMCQAINLQKQCVTFLDFVMFVVFYSFVKFTAFSFSINIHFRA